MSSIVRYAIAIAPSFETATRMSSELAANSLLRDRIAILGTLNRSVETAAPETSCVGRNRSAATGSVDGQIFLEGLVSDQILPSWALEDQFSLRKALDRWLIPAHVKLLGDAVEGGAFLVWVKLNAAEEEQKAALFLLHNSCASVAVHDFILPHAGLG